MKYIYYLIKENIIIFTLEYVEKCEDITVEYYNRMLMLIKGRRKLC